MENIFNVGDRIYDIEDGDCYYYGEVLEVNNNKVVKYKILKILWCNIDELDDEFIGKITEPIWWYIKKEKN